MKPMKNLIYTSLGTGALMALLVLIELWTSAFDPEILFKLLATLGVAFVGQIVVYLVWRDVNEESQGKKDGTIAR
jgi:hypothetical protein